MIFPLRPSFIEDFPAMFDKTGGDANRRPQDYRRTDLQAGKAQRQAFQRGGRKWRGLLQHGPILKKLSYLTATENGVAPIYGNFDGDTDMINDQNQQCSIFSRIPKHRLWPIVVWYWDVLRDVRISCCILQPYSNEVERKVAAGSFGGDSPLDR